MGEPKEAQLGQSLEGRPILSYTLGDGPPALLVIGGIHGAPEINSSALVWQLLTYFADEPDAIPEDVSLIFVPEANPDGIADGAAVARAGATLGAPPPAGADPPPVDPQAVTTTAAIRSNV